MPWQEEIINERLTRHTYIVFDGFSVAIWSNDQGQSWTVGFAGRKKMPIEEAKAAGVAWLRKQAKERVKLYRQFLESANG